MENFKEKIFPELFKFFLNVVSGVLLLYAGLVLKKSFEKNDSSLFSLNLSPAISVLLYAVYLSLFLYFSWKIIKGIRSIVFSYVDHLQDQYFAPTVDLDSFWTETYMPYKYFENREYDSFIFRVSYARISEHDWVPPVLLAMSEPKCVDKKCVTDLVVKRSYFGFYKYTCPACKKKYSSKYNASTLKSNFTKVIFAEHERKEDELPF